MKGKLKVPDSLEEITLGQYQDFLKIAESAEGDFLAQKMVEIFCGIPLSSVLLIRLQDVRDVNTHLNSLFQQTMKHKNVFTIKSGDVKQELGMIPNLENISIGEYADLERYIQDWQTMHNAMAVLYRPIKQQLKDKYSIVPYDGSSEFSELMRFTPLSVVFGAVVFFWNLGSELLKATLKYLEKETEELITQQGHSLPNNGDGIAAFTHSLKVMLDDLTKFQNCHSTNALHSFHLKAKSSELKTTTLNEH